MFFSEITSNVSGFRMPGHDERAAESEVDANEAMQFQGAGGETTQIFETSFDFGSHPIGALRLGEVPLLGEPVRHIAEEMRSLLHDFVHANTRRPSRYGFQAESHESPTMTPILKSFREAALKLEQIFSDRSQDDPMSIQIRSAAHRVQSGLESFCVKMTRSSPSEAIGENDLEGVLQECIELKGFLGTAMQQLDLMNVEYRAAILSQLQSLQGQVPRR